MRATDITTPMLLLTDQEKQAAQDNFSMAYACKNQGDYAGALLYYTAAAKVGHPGAQNNLAVMYRRGEGVSKDDQIAFQLYLEAARHGNAVAQRNVGRSYFNGTGTAADFASALAWLELAWENKDVKACVILSQIYGRSPHKDSEKEALWRNRAAGLGDEESWKWLEQHPEASADPEYLRRLHLSMPPMAPDRQLMSQHREFYRYKDIMPMAAAILGSRLYYLCSGGELCVSHVDGSCARLLGQVPLREDAWRIAVSSVGIFLHANTRVSGEQVLLIKQFSLDGREAAEHCLPMGSDSADILDIVDHIIYFCMDQGPFKSSLYAYDTSARTCRVLYSRASNIGDLYANREYLVFRAQYSAGDTSKLGWMLYQLSTGQIRCLDNSLSPENLLDHPEFYDRSSPAYVEESFTRDIVFFDLGRDIVWTERSAQEPGGKVRYWEPRPLTGDWGQLMPDMPIWRLDDNAWSGVNSGQRYFDGDRLFVAPSYRHFYGCTRTGEIHHWDMSGSSGDCDHFLVAGDLLLLDVDAHGEKLYRADPKPSAPLRDGWLSVVPAAERPAERQQQVPPAPKPQGGRISGGAASLLELEVEKSLTATNINYGILTLGSKFHIGFGIPVSVVFNGSCYSGKTHSTSKGRVDGLRQLFSDHVLAQGDVLRARYDPLEAAIYLTRL